MCSGRSEATKLPVKPAVAIGNPDDTETVESTAVAEPDVRANSLQTDDTIIASKESEISSRQLDTDTAKVEDEGSDTSRTRYSKSGRTTNVEESSNTNLQSSTIDIAKNEDESSDSDTQHSQTSSAPKTLQERIQESASMTDSQMEVSEEKTDSLYPLRTHLMQGKGTSIDVTTISEES